MMEENQINDMFTLSNIIKELKTENKKLQKEIQILKEGKKNLRYTNKSFLEDVEKYRKALEFYADISKYEDCIRGPRFECGHQVGMNTTSHVVVDNGKIARKALESEEIISVVYEKEQNV